MLNRLLTFCYCTLEQKKCSFGVPKTKQLFHLQKSNYRRTALPGNKSLRYFLILRKNRGDTASYLFHCTCEDGRDRHALVMKLVEKGQRTCALSSRPLRRAIVAIQYVVSESVNGKIILLDRVRESGEGKCRSTIGQSCIL